jgi:allantoin racemase
MAGAGIEREFKLMLKDAAERARIEALLPPPRRLLRQRNIFFDTDDGRQAAARLILRLREEEQPWLLTTKGPPLGSRGTLTAREEAERVLAPALAAHLAAGTVDPIPALVRAVPGQVAQALARRIAALADGRPVRPTGGFRNVRVLLEIALPGGATAMLALDRSLMPDGEEHHEVELEVHPRAAGQCGGMAARPARARERAAARGALEMQPLRGVAAAGRRVSLRILDANGNTTAAVTEICAAAARAAASPGTEIAAVTPRFGPAVISSRAENAIAAHGILDCLAAHHEGCDAAVLAVSYDTALAAARQLLPIPVLGMTEAACLTACTLGGRFGLVTFSSAELYRELIASYGLASRLAGIGLVAASPYDAASDPGGVAAKVAEAAAALARAGAEAVILGGAALAGMAPRIRDVVPVPLVDGIAAGVRLAEALAGLGARRPRAGSYAAPTGRASLGLDGALAALLRGSFKSGNNNT